MHGIVLLLQLRAMTVTIRDIASKLNVSPSTVSRSLAGSTRIHPKTRANVTQMAAHMGYNYSQRSSREQAAKQLMQIGVLLRSTQSHQSRVATQLLQGITSEIDRTDLSISIHASRMTDHDDIRPDELPKVVSGYGCDAVILEGRFPTELVARIRSHIPVVTMNWLYPGVNHDAVHSSDVQGICELVSGLYLLGHHKMAFIGLDHPASFTNQRQAGFIQACLQHNLPINEQIFTGTEMFDADIRPDIKLLENMLNNNITAMVCVNDLMARRIYQRLADMKIRVPEDVSLTGFDDAYATLPDGKKLATYNPQFIEIGRMAVQLAQRRLQQPLTSQVHAAIQGHMVQGHTCMRPK